MNTTTEIETKKAGILKRATTLCRSVNGDLRTLKRSVKKFGILQPIIERKADHSVIIGERRRSVAKAMGIKAPVVAVDVTPLEAAEMRVAEELSHEPHDRIALAEEIRRIYEEHGGGKGTFTVKDLAARLTVSESRIREFFVLAGMPDALKHQVHGGGLSSREARAIAESALADEDKARLAAKVAEHKVPGGRKLVEEILPSISRAPKESISLIRNKETNWDDVKRAEKRKAEREAAGPTDTVRTLEMEVRAMVQRWVDTLSHKANFDLIPLMTERGWHDVEMALLRLEEASRKWRSARPPARKVGEAREALAGDSGKFRQMVRDLSGVWHTAD
jgi:ParB/RepB/Spo0J family partition protein